MTTSVDVRRFRFRKNLGYLAFVVAPLSFIIAVVVFFYAQLVNEGLWGNIREIGGWTVCLAPLVGFTALAFLSRVSPARSPTLSLDVHEIMRDEGYHFRWRALLMKWIATVFTIGFGGSAGVEGASKWLGAMLGLAAQKLVDRIPRLRSWHGESHTTMMVGASAAVSAVFQAPLTGAIFSAEGPFVFDLDFRSLIPCLASAALAFGWYAVLHWSAHPFLAMPRNYELAGSHMLWAVGIGLCAGILSKSIDSAIVFLSRSTFHRWSPPVRYLTGGALLVGLAALSKLVTGTPVSLGSGLFILRDFINGRQGLTFAAWFIPFKILATAVTFGCGGAGGFLIPLATIGAALGTLFAHLPFVPAETQLLFPIVGMAATMSGGQASLLFPLIFVAESTGNSAMLTPTLIACLVSFVVSQAWFPHHNHKKFDRADGAHAHK
jgi:CIC family chloride channel protein